MKPVHVWIEIDETGQLYECWETAHNHYHRNKIVLEDLVTANPNTTLLFDAIRLLREFKTKNKNEKTKTQ